MNQAESILARILFCLLKVPYWYDNKEIANKSWEKSKLMSPIKSNHKTAKCHIRHRKPEQGQAHHKTVFRHGHRCRINASFIKVANSTIKPFPGARPPPIKAHELSFYANIGRMCRRCLRKALKIQLGWRRCRRRISWPDLGVAAKLLRSILSWQTVSVVKLVTARGLKKWITWDSYGQQMCDKILVDRIILKFYQSFRNDHKKILKICL